MAALAHLDDLHHPDQADRESHQDEDDGEEGQHVSEHSRALLAGSLVPCTASQFFVKKINYFIKIFSSINELIFLCYSSLLQFK